jgi:hypothetical protein
MNVISFRGPFNAVMDKQKLDIVKPMEQNHYHLQALPIQRLTRFG